MDPSASTMRNTSFCHLIWATERGGRPDARVNAVVTRSRISAGTGGGVMGIWIRLTQSRKDAKQEVAGRIVEAAAFGSGVRAPHG